MSPRARSTAARTPKPERAPTPERAPKPERPPSRRLFVAVELSEDVRRALASAIATLQGAGIDEGLRWVRPEGVHLTLKFLGSTPESNVAPIVDALRGAFDGATAFAAQPKGIGVFHGGKKAATFRTWRESYPHNVRVVFVGLDAGKDEVAALAARVEDALAPLGYPTEKRPFFPHLTLARVREDSDRPTREAIARKLSPFLPVWSNEARGLTVDRDLPFPPFEVNRVMLMQSHLRPGGAVYNAVQTFALGSAP